MEKSFTNREVADLLQKIAKLLSEQAISEAISLSNKVISMTNSFMPALAASSLQELGNTLNIGGQSTNAEPLLIKSIEIFQKNNLTSCVEYCAALLTLASSYLNNHKFLPAKKILIKLDMVIQSGVLDMDHPIVRAAQLIEANLDYRNGHYTNKLLPPKTKDQCANHWEYVYSRLGRGDQLNNLGKFEAAEKEYTECLSEIANDDIESRMILITLLQKLSSLYLNWRKYKKAIEVGQKVIHFLSLSGIGAGALSRAHFDIGRAYFADGQLDRASENAQKAIEMAPESSMNQVESLCLMGRVKAKDNQICEALKLLRTSFDIGFEKLDSIRFATSEGSRIQLARPESKRVAYASGQIFFGSGPFCLN